jgi:hypothetical protein
VGRRILLIDAVYGDDLGSVELQVEHFDFNEEYHGQIAFSADRSVMAAVGNIAGEGIRVWRVRDRTLIREIPAQLNEWLDLSADARLLVAGSCDTLAVWDIASGREVAALCPPYLACGYGAGFGGPFFGTAFSQDGALLAVGLTVSGTAVQPPPDGESGSWVQLYRLADGKRVGRWEYGLAPVALSADGQAIVGHIFFSAQMGIVDRSSGQLQSVQAALSPFVAVSPCGRWLLDYNGAAHEWLPPFQFRSPASAAPLEQFGPYLIPKTL